MGSEGVGVDETDVRIVYLGIRTYTLPALVAGNHSTGRCR